MSKAFKNWDSTLRRSRAQCPRFAHPFQPPSCAALRSRRGRARRVWSRFGQRRDRPPRRLRAASRAWLPLGLVWASVPLSREDPPIQGSPTSIRARTACSVRRPICSASCLPPTPTGAKWLRHGAWPEGAFPLRKAVESAARFAQGPDNYPFVPVRGEGVHEIPVGPVHAGTFEPGHFRSRSSAKRSCG